MPKGVYERTDQMRQNMSKAFRGRVAWNKRGGYYMNVIPLVNEILAASDTPMTIKQIYDELLKRGLPYSFNYVIRTLIKARDWNDVDNSRIINGRGGQNRKFKIGDKVRFNPFSKELPAWVKRELRLDTPRTITAIFTDSKPGIKRRLVYYLGSNRLGSVSGNLESKSFTSKVLSPWRNNGRGRPRTKRAYNQKNSLGGSQIYTDTQKTSNRGLTVSPSISCVNRREGVLI